MNCGIAEGVAKVENRSPLLFEGIGCVVKFPLVVTLDDLCRNNAEESPGCPADVDGDDAVDFADLLIVLSNWGPC